MKARTTEISLGLYEVFPSSLNNLRKTEKEKTRKKLEAALSINVTKMIFIKGNIKGVKPLCILFLQRTNQQIINRKLVYK